MDEPLAAVRSNVLSYKPLVFPCGVPDKYKLEVFGRWGVLPVNNTILPWATPAPQRKSGPHIPGGFKGLA